MASQYTGSPTATQSPAATPGIGVFPIGNLPVDGDALNASAFLQGYKVALDYIAFAQYHLWTGVSRYSSTCQYNYGYVVLWPVADGGDGSLYKCILAGTGNAPSDTDHWEQCGYSASQLGGTLSSGITPSIGSIADGIFTMAGPVKTVMFKLTLPLTDGAATGTVTLSSSAAFATAALHCQATVKNVYSYERLLAGVTSANVITVSISNVAVDSTVPIYVTIVGT